MNEMTDRIHQKAKDLPDSEKVTLFAWAYLEMRQERDDARRWAAAWRAIATARHWYMGVNVRRAEKWRRSRIMRDSWREWRGTRPPPF